MKTGCVPLIEVCLYYSRFVDNNKFLSEEIVIRITIHCTLGGDYQWKYVEDEEDNIKF